MNYIEIFTKKNCPYCESAKKLLTKKSLNFTEILIENNKSTTYLEMFKRSGRTTVPQIFINHIHIGGSDDLHALDENNKLDHLLIKPKNHTII